MHEPHIVQAIRNIAGRTSTRGLTARMGPRLGAWALIGALSCAALTVTSTEAAVSAPDLQRFRGQSRVLLVFAPRDDDAALIRQRAIVGQARPRWTNATSSSSRLSDPVKKARSCDAATTPPLASSALF